MRLWGAQTSFCLLGVSKAAPLPPDCVERDAWRTVSIKSLRMSSALPLTFRGVCSKTETSLGPAGELQTAQQRTWGDLGLGRKRRCHLSTQRPCAVPASRAELVVTVAQTDAWRLAHKDCPCPSWATTGNTGVACGCTGGGTCELSEAVACGCTSLFDTVAAFHILWRPANSCLSIATSTLSFQASEGWTALVTQSSSASSDLETDSVD